MYAVRLSAIRTPRFAIEGRRERARVEIIELAEQGESFFGSKGFAHSSHGGYRLRREVSAAKQNSRENLLS